MTLSATQPALDAAATAGIEGQVLAHLRDDLIPGQADGLAPDTPLDGLIDSTAIMELVVWVEGTFGFTVELDDITPDNFGSVGQLTRWIARNTGRGDG